MWKIKGSDIYQAIPGSTHIAKNSGKCWISGRNDENDDIQVENNSSKSNDIVQIRA